MGKTATKYDSEMASVPGRFSEYVPGSVWFYQPNTWAPNIFIGAFLITGAVHAWQTHRYKSWRVTLFIPWGALLMAVGFILREIGAHHIDNLAILIASVVLTMSGPPVYAGANYFILGRTLYYIPWLSPIHPGRVVTTFIGVDLLIEVMIANGVSKVANTDASHGERLAGEILVKIALILQAVTFLGYILILAIWHVRVKRAGLLKSSLRTVVWELYASSTLITVRCIYRIVEYFQGYTGEVYTHEAYFYVFDAVLMLINSVLLNVFHPGRFFPRSNKIYLARDGVTERRGPGWRDPRVWWWQVIDPFDFQSCIRRDGQFNFWDHPEPQNEDTGEAERAGGAAGDSKGHAVSGTREKPKKSAWEWLQEHSILLRLFRKKH